MARSGISIHAPLAGCDVVTEAYDANVGISIHAPLAGCDVVSDCGGSIAVISIHAPLAGCDGYGTLFLLAENISIHAPLAGCDLASACCTTRTTTNFNPRTPCGVRPTLSVVLGSPDQFQSTHPLRGATKAVHLDKGGGGISIHAPLAGCDSVRVRRRRAQPYFNPRTPCGVRRSSCMAVRCWKYFNPRTPCGVRRRRVRPDDRRHAFQSTHPLRGATRERRQQGRGVGISIHAPLAGCDLLRKRCAVSARDFNPRTPCGVRHGTSDLTIANGHFNPRTPCGVRHRRTAL